MRYATDRGINLIKSFEGFSAITYIDAAGIPTIGFGHAIRKGEYFPGGITEEQATEILRRDVRHASNAVTRLIRVPLTDNQFDVLTSFTYNLGAAALQRSTLRAKINREDYDVASEFPKWCWAGGRKLPGLVKRRKIEAGLYLS